MSKVLEALKRIRQETCPATYMADFDKNECCDVIEQALQRLEAIDNANPSEALECVNWLDATIPQWCREKSKELPDTIKPIKQALLKAQEPKHYLKWEDLEFDDEWKYQEVKLNGTKYTIKYKCDFDFFDNYYEVVKIYNQNERKQLFKLYNDKQFFNDLHLERVEE